MRAAVLLCLLPTLALADVPDTLTVQGALRTDAGVAPDGEYKLKLTLYAAQTGGDELWSEVHAAVSVSEGVFHVQLGVKEPFPAGVFDQNASLWLALSVDSDPELPRARVGSAAYALTASTAQKLSCSGCIDPEHLSFNPFGGTYAELSGQAIGLQLHNLDGAPGDCNGASAGKIYWHSGIEAVVVCDGKTWERMALCRDTCATAETTPCGAAIVSACGDACAAGTGTWCPNEAECTDGACGSTETGATPETAGTSCKQILADNPATESSHLWIKPPGYGAAIRVYCDMATLGGGWTLCYANAKSYSTVDVVTGWHTLENDESYNDATYSRNCQKMSAALGASVARVFYVDGQTEIVAHASPPHALTGGAYKYDKLSGTHDIGIEINNPANPGWAHCFDNGPEDNSWGKIGVSHSCYLDTSEPGPGIWYFTFAKGEYWLR